MRSGDLCEVLEPDACANMDVASESAPISISSEEDMDVDRIAEVDGDVDVDIDLEAQQISPQDEDEDITESSRPTMLVFRRSSEWAADTRATGLARTRTAVTKVARVRKHARRKSRKIEV